MSEHERLRPLSASQREALEEATATYQAAHTAASAAYLLARGIDRETATSFRVGVVGTDPAPGHGRYRGRISIPYLDKDGYPLSMRFRCIENHTCRDFGHGKYLSMVDEPSRVYNIAAVHNADDTIHVCEGEFDAMILTKVGLHAVAIPGVNAWKNHHRRMLAGFSRVWVWADPDDAGADFSQRLTRAMRQAKGVRLRVGDVTEEYLAGGASTLHALISQEVAA